MKIAVELPVLVEIEDPEWEAYSEGVVDFLKYSSGKKIKYKFVGYAEQLALVLFYTSVSDSMYKSLLKTAELSVKEWQETMEEEESSSYCPRCGDYLRPKKKSHCR